MADLNFSSLELDNIFGGASQIIDGVHDVADGFRQMVDPDSRRTPQGMSPYYGGANMPYSPYQQQPAPVPSYGYGYSDGTSTFATPYINQPGVTGQGIDPGYGIDNNAYIGPMNQFNIGGLF